MSNTNESVAIVFADAYQQVHGERPNVEYDKGWYTIEYPDGTVKKSRRTQIEGETEDLRQDAISAKNAHADQQFGWVTWWTVHQVQVEEEKLQKLAEQCGIPGVMHRSLIGAPRESAFLKGTQLGARGKPSADHESGIRARYLTRNAGEYVRVIIRERIDENNVRVSTQQVATIGLDQATGRIVREIEVSDTDIRAETTRLIDAMEDDMHARIGMVDAQRIRTSIQRWLEKVHRVCMRGTGGVYFVPMPPMDYDRKMVEDEIRAVRRFVSEAHVGTFTHIGLTRDMATTVSDFEESATEELNAALDEINEKLRKWESNDGMNDGSRMYSATTQVDGLDQMGEQIATLEHALQTKLGTIRAKHEIVRARASKMMMESSSNVEAARRERRSKKSGTAKERQEEPQAL